MCFYLINKSCLSLKQYICIQVGLSCVFNFVNFVIDWMFKNTFQFSVFFLNFHLLVFVLCHNPMLPFSLDCPFLLAPTYKYIWLSYIFVQILLNDTDILGLIDCWKCCPASLLCYCDLAIYEYITNIFSLYFLLNFWLSSISETRIIIHWVLVSGERAQIT
jgi:hypothetical protein